MGGKRRAPKKSEGTVGASYNMTPSAIHVDENLNRRAKLYPIHPELANYIDGTTKCTHSIENIEARLASFKQHGQLAPVTIYLTLTGDAFLVIGYLRWLASLLAEARGELAECGFKSKGKLACIATGEPTTPACWLALADKNIAENAETVPLTPIDIALNIQRYTAPVVEGGFAMSLEDAAARVGGYAKRTGAWYLRLLKLSPTKVMLIHTGKLLPTAALKKAKEQGEAGSPGPRAGVPRSSMKLAFKHAAKRPPPTDDLCGEETRVLLEVLTGHTKLEELVDGDGNDVAPPIVRQWLGWLTPPADVGTTSKNSGKKPPKKGK